MSKHTKKQASKTGLIILCQNQTCRGSQPLKHISHRAYDVKCPVCGGTLIDHQGRIKADPVES